MTNSLNETLDRFANLSCLIVGDVMVDRYWWGSVTRISPEAPVPVVQLTSSSIAAGGAGNVAANVAGLGAQPILVGVKGEDDAGRELDLALKERGVSPDGLIGLAGRPTTVKTRIVAHQQQVVRIDQEETAPVIPPGADSLASAAVRSLSQAKVVVLSDYAKGVLTPALVSQLIGEARQLNIPVLVDPKGRDYARYSGARLLTPNRTEAALACGFDPHENDIVTRSGAALLRDLPIDAVLITEGEDGMTLFERGRDPVHLDASARQVYDVTGAGDTVIATLGVALGAGADLLTSAKIANVAAGLVVQQVGTATVTLDQLRQQLGSNAPN